MKLTKALAIGGASTAGVGATAYGAKELTSRIQEGVRRSNLIHQAKEKIKKIEKVWEEWGYKALDDESEDRKGEGLQLKKVLDDGVYKKSESPYSGLEKDKWEGEYGKRIKNKSKEIVGVDFETVEKIHDNNSENGKKLKEICLIGYAKGQDDGGENTSNDVETTEGHACLFVDGEIPWEDLETKYKTDTSQNPGDIYGERIKKERLQPPSQ